MIYPNIYVVLVGPSGKSRKGIAIGIGKDLLSEVAGIVLIANSTNREALVKRMKESSANFSVPGSGRIEYHCSVTAMSEELSVFLGQKDTKFLVNLTDWYDSKDKWEYETISRGTDFVNGVCFNFLGGTAPDWLQSMLPQEAIGGGFTSRVIFVVEETKGKTVAKQPPTDVRLRESLIADLCRINNLAGPFHFDKGGEHAYTSWYENYDKEIARGTYPIADPRFASYCERRATHLRKIAMLVSASRSDSLVIQSTDITRALDILSKTELKMHKTFGGMGKSKIAVETHRVLEYIQSIGIAYRSSLLAKFYSDLTIQDFKMIEDLMDQMRVVTIEVLKGGEKIYRWKGKTNSSQEASSSPVDSPAEAPPEPSLKPAYKSPRPSNRKPLPH